jgi:hypothetical protein
MKTADAFEIIDHNDVLRLAPRHKKPCTDDVVAAIFHRTTGGGRSVLLTRARVQELRDWADRWLAEGWDGVPRRCADRRSENGYTYECDQEPGHPGATHEGRTVSWPSNGTRHRASWAAGGPLFRMSFPGRQDSSAGAAGTLPAGTPATAAKR